MQQLYSPTVDITLALCECFLGTLFCVCSRSNLSSHTHTHHFKHVSCAMHLKCNFTGCSDMKKDSCFKLHLEWVGVLTAGTRTTKVCSSKHKNVTIWQYWLWIQDKCCSVDQHSCHTLSQCNLLCYTFIPLSHFTKGIKNSVGNTENEEVLFSFLSQCNRKQITESCPHIVWQIMWLQVFFTGLQNRMRLEQTE